MVLFERPDASADALEWMTGRAEILLQRLGLAYRVLLMSTREMGFTQARKYDLEVWSPGVERWLEVSSCSNFGDFQARRMAIRYRPEPGAKPELVHTLNGSGLALARIVAAILETYQRPDGTIAVPEVLRPYLGRDTIARLTARSGTDPRRPADRVRGSMTRYHRRSREGRMSASPPPTVSWQSPESQAGPAPGIEFAPHGGRLVAYIIDSIIVSIVVVIIFTIGAFALGSGATVEGNRVTEISSGSAIIATILFLIGFLVGLLYFPFFWARGGQTPGMRPFDLRVVRDSDGGAIGWGTALLRLVGLIIAGAVFYLGYIWIFIDKRRRGWQDLIAGTIVVKQP